MPKLPHEALVQLVRNAPETIVKLLDPDHPVDASIIHVTQSEFVDLNFAEYRSDVVVHVGESEEHPEKVIVYEAQGSIDRLKRRRWPLFLAGPFARFGCDVELLVLTLDREVVRWAEQPIVLGGGCMVVKPRVIGPDAIPVITDFDEARRAPEMAVLSVGAHADEPGAERIALAALAASSALDNDRATLYPDFVFAFLGEAARQALEELMATTGYKYQSEFARKYVAEGRAEGLLEGEARLLLRLLDLKGLTVDDTVRERVLACRDPEQLEVWAGRVLVAGDLEAIFGDG